MNKEIKDKLETAGYTVSNAQEFLGLSDDEMKIIEIVNEFNKLKRVLKEVGPFEVVSGDALQRNNTNTGIRLNSMESWVVGNGQRSFIKLMESVKIINKYC